MGLLVDCLVCWLVSYNDPLPSIFFEELHLVDLEALQAAARQLHLPPELLQQGLLKRKVVTGRVPWRPLGKLK